MANDDWDMVESLKYDNSELKSRNRQLYYFLDEIMDEIQIEHGLNSPVYLKIKKFFEQY